MYLCLSLNMRYNEQSIGWTSDHPSTSTKLAPQHASLSTYAKWLIPTMAQYIIYLLDIHWAVVTVAQRILFVGGSCYFSGSAPKRQNSAQQNCSANFSARLCKDETTKSSQRENPIGFCHMNHAAKNLAPWLRNPWTLPRRVLYWLTLPTERTPPTIPPIREFSMLPKRLYIFSRKRRSF